MVPEEIRRVAIEPERYDLKPLIGERKKEFEADMNMPTEQVERVLGKGDPMELIQKMLQSGEPLARGMVGKLPKVRPELKADIYGVPGSSGVAEGPARVILLSEELDQIKEGEILVAPQTYATWTSVFPILKGVVVDSGGALSHAAIVSREMRIPCVVNSMKGTSVIKTGQRIRVNGDEGTVYFLDK